MTKMISARPASALRLEVAFCVILKLVVNYFSARGYGEKPEESGGSRQTKRLSRQATKYCVTKTARHILFSRDNNR